MGDGRGANSSIHGNNKPEWLEKYDVIGKIGEGTYGLVFLAKVKANRSKSIAIKKFKQSKDGDGVSPTAIREIMASYLYDVGDFEKQHVMPIGLNGYDPKKRITAVQALEHEYFRMEPFPGRNALVSPQPGEKLVSYTPRPVDTSTDIEGTISLQPSQRVSSGNSVNGGMSGPHVMQNRSMARPMTMVGMPRMQPPGMQAYSLASQAGMGGVNPGAIPNAEGSCRPDSSTAAAKEGPWYGDDWIPSTTEIKAFLRFYQITWNSRINWSNVETQGQ